MSNGRMQFVVEGAQIIWRNFAGQMREFNPEGNRNFNLVLTPELADQLAADGWNVRTLAAREEGDPEGYVIKVTVSFKNFPPRVVLLTEKTRTQLDEGSVAVLDYADIENIDLICQSYNWSAGGKTGISAYLKTMFVTIREDYLEKKYDFYANQGTPMEMADVGGIEE
jgi:hypothetical protein